jgi:sugar O-acyltransferase (sialic acid O-acetyltransferase NeuD family)
MKKLLIFPFNGNALETVDCLGSNFELIGFIDDTKEKQNKTKFGIPIYERDVIQRYPEAKILAVPGSPTSYLQRKKIIESLTIPEKRFATVIHPAASISKMAKVGYNVLIMAGVVITSNAIIGDHVCILPNTVIHHDTIVGDLNLIGSNVSIAGSVNIGDNCYIGSGSRIINNIMIGKNSLLGLGSNVIRTVPENTKVAGNPAKII